MKNRRHHQKREKKGIKVTYISSPMKVKTCASNFRALVQKLTGKYSNVAEATFVEEAHYENDDYELIMNGSLSSSSLELDEQQWRKVAGPEPHEEEEEEVAPSWLKLKDPTDSLMDVDPLFSEQLVLEYFGFDGL